MYRVPPRDNFDNFLRFVDREPHVPHRLLPFLKRSQKSRIHGLGVRPENNTVDPPYRTMNVQMNTEFHG